MITLGSYIQEIRQRQNLSTRKLATISGVSHSEISKIETGKRQTPLPNTLSLLSEALNISPLKLYYLAGYINEEEYSFLAVDPISFETISRILLINLPNLSGNQKMDLINILNTKAKN